MLLACIEQMESASLCCRSSPQKASTNLEHLGDGPAGWLQPQEEDLQEEQAHQHVRQERPWHAGSPKT